MPSRATSGWASRRSRTSGGTTRRTDSRGRPLDNCKEDESENAGDASNEEQEKIGKRKRQSKRTPREYERENAQPSNGEQSENAEACQRRAYADVTNADVNQLPRESTNRRRATNAVHRRGRDDDAHHTWPTVDKASTGRQMPSRTQGQQAKTPGKGVNKNGKARGSGNASNQECASKEVKEGTGTPK